MNIDQIAAAVEAHAQAGTGRKGSQVIQTRRVVAALRAIGVKRSDFTAQTAREPDGCYGAAIGSLKTADAHAKVIEHADTLVACGMKVVIYSGGKYAFVGTSDHPSIDRY